MKHHIYLTLTEFRHCHYYYARAFEYHNNMPDRREPRLVEQPIDLSAAREAQEARRKAAVLDMIRDSREVTRRALTDSLAHTEMSAETRDKIAYQGYTIAGEWTARMLRLANIGMDEWQAYKNEELHHETEWALRGVYRDP